MNFAFTYMQCSQIKVSSCVVDNTVIKIICVGIQNAGLFSCSSGCLISSPGFLLLGSCHVQRMVLSHNPVANAAYIRPWGPSRCMHLTHTPFLATHPVLLLLSLSQCQLVSKFCYEANMFSCCCLLNSLACYQWYRTNTRVINLMVAVQLQQKTTTFCMWNGLLLDSYLMTSNW